MKKTASFVFLFSVLILHFTQAQTKTIQRTEKIVWQSPAESRTNLGEPTKVLPCEGCNAWKNNNRFPHKTIFIEGMKAKTVKTLNEKWVELPVWELAAIDTSAEFQQTQISFEKGEKERAPGTEITISLIRKNGRKWEKLESLSITAAGESFSESEKRESRIMTEGNSVLATGSWVKMGVITDGVYQLTAADLRPQGLELNGTLATEIKIYGSGGKMLSEANRDFKFTDLRQIAIQVEDGGDGVFNENDRILFFGQGPDNWNFNSGTKLFNFQKNLYSDTSYYFITTSPGSGLRIAQTPSDPLPEIIELNYHEKWAYAPDNVNVLSAGREWYADVLDFNSTKSIVFQTPNLVTDSSLTVNIGIMARSSVAYPFKITMNGVGIGLDITPSPVNLSARFSNYGTEAGLTRVLKAGPNTGSLNFNILYDKQGNFTSIGYINHVVVNGFRSLGSGGNFGFKAYRYPDKNVFYQILPDGQSRVWDVTFSDKINAISTISGGFSKYQDTIRDYFVFRNQNLPKPVVFKSVVRQNLRGMVPPDLLIVSSPAFYNQALRLAAFRRDHDNLEVEVVVPEQIYNEFSSGAQDVTAIRNFAMHLYYKTETPKLKYLLLFGDCSFDYKNRTTGNTNFVPTYSSVEYLSIIPTYASDDFFGILNRTKGGWGENDLMDIGVGRLPSKSESEAAGMVNKLISYCSSSEAFGPWRDRFTFVADNGDGCYHSKDANNLADPFLAANPQANLKKIFMAAYPLVSSPGGNTSPTTTSELLNTIEQGSLIINYSGHGGETVWADEFLFTSEMIEQLKNKNRLPFFITATCDFGRHDYPSQVSGGESLMLNPNGGAIGIMTTGRPVTAQANFIINQAFYNSLYQNTSGRTGFFGDVFRMTKNICSEKRNNRGFTLLGDPSCRFPFPKQNIVLTNFPDSDTMRGLQLVEFSGEIQNPDGVKDGSFNGTLYANIFDKPGTLEMDLNQYGFSPARPCAYPYQKNQLFNGAVPVKNGEFTVRFFVSRDVSFQVGNGRLLMYAEDKTQKKDANGYKTNIKVGGLNPNPKKDDEGPEIKLFMNDYSFADYGLTGKDATLWVDLNDESGIDVTGLGLGHDLTATLDGNEVYVMNEYFQNAEGSYQKGFVRFPFRNLTAGLHSLTVKAWDNFNNSSEATIWFEVGIAQVNGKIADKFNLYPNPFSSEIYLSLENAQVGDNLDISLVLTDLRGRRILEKNWLYENSIAKPGAFRELVWDGSRENGEKLSPGTYICEIFVKSDTNDAVAKFNRKIVYIR
jgi:hypothetical protein